MSSTQQVETTEVLNVSVTEAQDGDMRYLEFRFPPKTRFENASALFGALRDLVVEYFDKSFWMIKIQSRVTCTNMPLLQDPTNLRVLMDILQGVRDPTMEVYRKGYIRLYFFPSMSNYYRKKVHARPVRLGTISGPEQEKQDRDTNGNNQ